MKRKKKKEPKKGKCKKCETYFYIHDHHILPKSDFGKNGDTINLCPNCHTHCHVYMEMNLENPENAEEVRTLWEKWFKTIAVVVTSVLIFLVWNFI